MEIKVNEKAIKKGNRTFKLVGTLAVMISMASGLISLYIHNKNTYKGETTSVVQYYGDESKESQILEYIEVSKRLSKLDLDKYEIDDELVSSYYVSSKLASPEELNKKIDELDKIGVFILSKNLNEQSKNLNLVLNLKKQEKLVNRYIYEEGYDVAYRDIKDAVKEYTGEVFNVEPKNVKLEYNRGGTGTPPSVDITSEDKSYEAGGAFTTDEEDKIVYGVSNMVNVDKEYINGTVNEEEYNEKRNSRIRAAIVNSASLQNEVEKFDLYNEKLAGKMR